MFYVVLLFALLSLTHSADPEVTTSFGTIRGSQKKVHVKFVDEYLGIPFAKPPIGDLRFAKPKKWTDKWSETLVAQKVKPACMQWPMVATNEDCLYLNIWTPSNRTENKLLPVMFWIHGGGFASGSGAIFGGVISALTDVIVVSVNYRLNIFGFLYGNSDEVPGNVGLYDQALAMTWVNENIIKFGGDPNMVTIFGESAGGWSVTLHLMSPISKSYFHRAIVMSGTAMDYLSVDTKEWAFQRAKAVLKAVKCEIANDSTSMSAEDIKCIRSKDAMTILKALGAVATAAPRLVIYGFLFLPVFGEAFIPKAPREILKEKALKTNCSLLIGTVFNELVVKHYIQPNVYPSWWMASFLQGSPPQFINFNQSQELIKIYFTGIDQVKNRDYALQTATQLYGDISFNCPSAVFGEIFSEIESNSVYQYLFNYKSTKDNPGCDPRYPCHASDVPIVFGTVGTPLDINPSLSWLHVFSNFAKTGTTSWPKYYRTAEKRLVPSYYEFKGHFDAKDIKIGYRLFQCKIWKSMVLL